MIILSSLRITAIFSSTFVRNRVAFIWLLYLEVAALAVLLGSEIGPLEGLSQVTTGYFLSSKGILGFAYYFLYEENIYLDVLLIAFSIPVIFSNSATYLPKVKFFENLHLTENLKAAIQALKGVAGVYAIINTLTGAIYIGSSFNIGDRMRDHIIDNITNEHLQNAIAKYGLENFQVVLVEVFELDSTLSNEENRDNLLVREQHWLDWLFSFPASLRYNFLPIASSSLGYKHTSEAKAKMSEAKTGSNHPAYGKTGELSPMYGKSPTEETRAKISTSLTGHVTSDETRKLMSDSQKKVNRSGENHPGFGKVPSSAHAIYVYSLDHVLIQQFPSKTAAARWLNVSDFTVRYHIKHNKVFQGKYILTISPINNPDT